MDKRIKTLYIITIIAIVTFLGMQLFWLYSRYELNLDEYEENLSARISECVDDYYNIRDAASLVRKDSLAMNNEGEFILPYYHSIISIKHGEMAETRRKIIVYTCLRSIYNFLGIPLGEKLTEEHILKLAENKEALKEVISDSTVYEATGAKDEQEAWQSFKNIELDHTIPFAAEGMDSVLKKAGIKAEVSLAKAYDQVWRSGIEYNKSLFFPSVSVTIPYSQLEGKTVSIVRRINPLKVIPGMWQTLMITLMVSVLLIVCLVLQISTVLKLSRIDKMRNSFVTTMIHELKRPLSTLKMCVSGIENDIMMENPATRAEIMGETRNALDNLSAYFSKLRDITFNGVEQIPLNIQTINLRKLFDSAADACAIPGGKEVVFTNTIGEEITVPADRSHLFNIFTNLIENAVKYSGSSVNIQASAAADSNGNIEIRISDNGNGIAADDLRHIFNRFYRGKASATELPGMGLGLTYVRLLVRAHGGEVKAESAVGKGSCFTIILPQ